MSARDAEDKAEPAASAIAYFPQALVAAEAPHETLRMPRNQKATASCHPSTPCRFVDLVRWADRPYAELAIKDMGIRIDIDLDAATLRQLAFQLLDAAHDIEQMPPSGMSKVAS